MDIAELGMKIDTRSLERASDSNERFVRTGRNVDRTARQVEGSADRMGSAYRRAAGAIALATGAIAATGAALRASQQYVGISNGLRSMGQSAEQAGSTLDQLGKIANRTRAPLEATAELYRRISIAGRDLGASGQQVMRFTENVGLALAASGTSAQEASGALLQLSQAMAGGVVRAEEFNSILEGAFPIAQAAADGIDAAAGSVGRLRQLVVDGKISSDEFFQAILSQTDALELAFANTVPTISQAMTVLNNSFTLFAGRLDSTLGISAAIAKSIIFLAENIERLGTYAATAAVIIGGRFAASMLLAAVRTAGFSGALLALRGAIMRTGIGALIVGAGELVYQFLRLVKGAGGFGNAMSLLGEVAVAVWEGMVTAAQAVPPGLASVWKTIAAGFYMLVSDLADMWSSFLQSIAGSIEGIDAFSGVYDKLQGSITGVIKKSGDYAEMSSKASQEAEALAKTSANLASQGFDKARDALSRLSATVSGSEEEITGMTGATDGANKALGDLGGSSGGASKAAKKLKEVKDAATAFRDAMKDAAFTAEDWGKEKAQILISGIDGISNAFGDFVSRGFTDFKDFASSILKSFQGMISQMVAMAVKNRIMISLGFGGVSGAAGGGMGFGGLLGGGAGGAAGGGGGFGLTSLLGGIGSSFKALGSIFGIGSTTMASLGGFGAALGAAIPAIGILAVGISALIGKTTELDRGIRVTVNGMDALVQTFRRTETSRLFGLLKSKKTRLGSAPDEVADPVIAAISDIQTSVIDMAAALDIGANAFAGFSTVLNVSTRGMSQEDAAQAVQDALKGVADEMAEMALQGHDVIRAGEGASDALSRLAGALAATQTVFDTLGHTMFDVSIAGADMASQLVDLFGGIDAFNSATTTYFNAFYSETERVAISVRQATAALDQFGIALPQSRAQYRQLVESIDLTSERGRELYATLLGLAGVMDRVLPAVQSFTQMISDLVGESTSIIDVMIREANEMARQAAQASANWYRAADSLRDLVRDLKSTEIGSGAMQLGASSSAMQKAFSAAIGGDAESAQQVPQLARTFLQVAETQATSAVEFRRAQARVLNQSKTLAGVAEIEGFNKTVLERLYETQISVLTELRDYLTGADAIDAQVIAGFEGQLGSLEEAIKAAEMFSYEYLKERLKVTVDLLPEANIPEDVRKLLKTAANGINSVIEFAVRADDLTPEMRWLALRGASEHLKTIEYTAKNRLPADLSKIALAGSSSVTKTIQVALKSLTPAERSIINALDGTGRIEITAGNSFGRLTSALDRLTAAIIAEKAYVPAVPAPAPAPAPATPVTPTGPKYSASNFQVSEGLVAYTDTVDRIGATLFKQGYTVRGPLGGTRTFDTQAEASAIISKVIAGTVPAFAMGGTHRGGLARVGENDMELVAPSRIYSPSETRQMLDNRAVVNELRAMRKENRELRDTMEQFEREAFRDRRKVRKILEQAEVIGLPVRNPDDGTPLETTT
ncbi:MAG: tape measure protein [Sagittula sp.]|uniref:tape measure protein n=1 Tax=Sagittula sp. TaxID=2038081 RepID=UPI004059B5B9